jgi:hypothetical protein
MGSMGKSSELVTAKSENTKVIKSATFHKESDLISAV